MFGGAKDFCPNFPKPARKIFVRLLPTNFLPQRSQKNYFDVTSPKKSVRVFFCKRWAPFFEIKQHWAQFFPDFQGIHPDFQVVCLDF